MLNFANSRRKSQLAIEYAHRVRQKSPDTWVFWVHASNSARLEEAFNDIAERVGLSSGQGTAADNLRLIREWLCNKSNGRWLMIVDNVDKEISVESQKDGESVSLASLLPQSDNGAILITSRNTEIARSIVGREQDIIPVDSMSAGEAVQLLEKKLVGDSGESATQLALILDNIPLAIVQAAAYINRLRPRMTAAKYLNEFKKLNKRAQLLHKAVEDMRRDGQASNSVLTTWHISFEYIREKRPSAADLLSFMSFFNRQGIPEFMLRQYTKTKANTQDDSLDTGLEEEELDSEEEEEFDFEEDVAFLRAFSLVNTTQREDEFEMHSLVQFATRIWLKSINIEERWHQTFIRAMAQEFPNGKYKNWPKCRVLFPHVLPLVEQERLADSGSNKWAQLLYFAGWYAWEQGQFFHAEKMLRIALETHRKILPANNVMILYNAGLLGRVCSDAGNNEAAQEMLRETLVAAEKVLGKEHSWTLKSMNSLAVVLNRQGKHEEAEAIHREVLALRDQALGKEHPDTQASMNNLASALYNQGEYEEAEAIQREMLALKDQALGKEHPDTLLSMNNMAIELDSQGKHEEAEAIYRQVLALREQVIGKEHPKTLSSVHNLAGLLAKQQLYDESTALYQRAYSRSSVVLGDDHPTTQKYQQDYQAMLRIMERRGPIA
jgi:tetratricopeptide (TPR) repeat protein